MKVKTASTTIDIPKSFILFGSKYTVEIDNQANDWKDSLGLFNQDLKKIKIATQLGIDVLPSDTILETYYHELAHALVRNTEEIELYKNEKFISLLGNLLRQYMDTVKS